MLFSDAYNQASLICSINSCVFRAREGRDIKNGWYGRPQDKGCNSIPLTLIVTYKLKMDEERSYICTQDNVAYHEKWVPDHINRSG